ncbi:PaaI family thioesterase [Dyella caseinilytica]|uniref:Medium/long-chain acyl-CoA thioesterase YigI n=2 Tax=Dyella caseinilytica TaxID=1849581 RepID=A0ABX7H183_9GAMM|nr:PaaI family thioesterase [Dyella caseinilytica]
MKESLAFGTSVLQSQPFSVLLGAKLVVFAEGHAEIQIPINDQLKQQHGFVHGGVISYAADNALTFAGGSVLGAGVVTSEFKINYLRPALGDCLIARAQVIHAGKNQAVCRCDLFCTDSEGERLCATSQGTITRLGSPSAENTQV